MSLIKKAAKKMADGISKLSVLSPQQIKDVDKKRSEYLREKPDLKSEETQELVRRNLGAIGIDVYQAYLSEIKNMYLPIKEENAFNSEARIKFFEITRWVFDKEEDGVQKLVNVYNTLNKENCSIALVFERKINDSHIYIGVSNTSPDNADPAIAINYSKRIENALLGNFPGAVVKESDSNPLKNVVDSNGENGCPSVCSISNIASERSEKFLSQGIERLLDAVNPADENEEYRLVLIAEPIRDQLAEKTRIQEICTALSPFENWQTNYMTNESTSYGSSGTFGVNLGFSAGVQGGTSFGTGTDQSISTAINQSANINPSVSVLGCGGSLGGYSNGRTNSNSSGTSTSFNSTNNYNANANFGVSFSRASTVNVQLGKLEGIIQNFSNHAVKNAMEMLKEQIKRIEESSSFGMWKFAAYSISSDPSVAINVANIYLSLTQGDKSYLSNASINSWDGEIESDETKTICEYLANLKHPQFGLKPTLPDEWLQYPTIVDSSTKVSGKELAMSLNMPKKSIPGLPVLESVPFGREPHMIADSSKLDTEIGLGYHMRKEVDSKKISISKDELTKHVFVTGSTGSGKTNTVCELLRCLKSDDTKFLIIEPAKGEYKKHLKNWKDVTVYGTNPNIAGETMLKINPFAFDCEKIHILEHLDKLVEIFNVCWPMYAAMPAILKDSIEKAYMDCGWDLLASSNKHSNKLFPSFSDVFREIKTVLKESDYSDESKGDYTGALVTRIKSLTNGINGLIFSNSAADDSFLFENNAIIDLSRVGSSETKSLLMAILVLKLQEYHLGKEDFSSVLKHITVIEEAHNILKKTSTEFNSESSNTAGKSVEMLANSIAEMRAYGEGFVIVDQSPSLLDSAAIRNTNTKIIMRLPALEDRELVGKASGLSDKQIEELVRLERGVASVSQSDWIESVLVKFEQFNPEATFENHKKSVRKASPEKYHGVTIKDICMRIINKELNEEGEQPDICLPTDLIVNLPISGMAKADLIEYASASDLKDKHNCFKKALFELSDFEKTKKLYNDSSDSIVWAKNAFSKTMYDEMQLNASTRSKVLCLLLDELSYKDPQFNQVLTDCVDQYKKNGGLF